MINFSDQQPIYRPYFSILIALLLLLVMFFLNLFDNKPYFLRYAIASESYFSQVRQQPSELYRLVSSLFIHGNWSHWLINSSVFLLLAPPIERVLGGIKFLQLFFAAGIVGNLVACFLLIGNNHLLLGASGAVSGLIGAWLMLFPRREIRFIFPIGFYLQKTALPLMVVVLLWLSIQIALQFLPNPIYNVAWISHIAGFVTGFLLTWAVK